MEILSVSNLKKVYTTRFGGNQVQALKNINFSVDKGEYVAVMGESGSGKTTLLNILAALDKPTAGNVLLNGVNLSTVKEKEISAFRREHLGFVFQDFNLLDQFCLKDNILLPLVLAGVKPEQMEPKVYPLAKKLGIAYYDKNIINEIAEKSGLSPEYIQENAELSPKKGLFAYAFAGRDITGKSVEDMVYEAQRKVILDLAEKEPCVIIGRNADYILKDRDDVLNVYIHGDMPEKIQRICKLHNTSEADAVKMINDIDKRRMTNYNFYTDQKWGKAANYTLCLNSSQLGYDKCESIIIECV